MSNENGHSPPTGHIKSFEDLDVYKLARLFRKGISSVVSSLPSDERFRLGIQMKKAALSMTNNIAEGVGRFHYQENIQFCRQARGSITELIDDLNACLDEGYIDESCSVTYKQEAYRLIKVLNGYIASQKRRKG